MNSYR